MSTSIHENMLRVDHLKELLKKIDVLEKDIVFEIRDEDAFQNTNFINRIIRMYSGMKFAITINARAVLQSSKRLNIAPLVPANRNHAKISVAHWLGR